ncbi:hypothetical protein [Saccharothrix longispora]|uniref:hypothetical protein n=1 Tax=Saccharothrix longispora TaxID=33920 RepID=UPI0028FD7C44|nr:hypothetical protein [Saccharothrix longispora]MDU0291893.1 hypothetical protein [Saccharothrix longispora]
MVGEDLELLITAVVAADDERQARAACAGLLRLGGRVVRASDCSDEEPGCWSVTISSPSGERVARNVAAALARAVRSYVRRLGDDLPVPRVSCEPPTAWTVLDDPDRLDGLLPGAERLLVEAWVGGDPAHREEAAAEPAEPVGAERPTTHLLLRVDVETDRAERAEWQARAVASRVAGNGKITRVAPLGHALSVHVDLGSVETSAEVALQDAVTSLGRSGWTSVEWSEGSATTRWSAAAVPPSGITALGLTATPASAFVWTVPD